MALVSDEVQKVGPVDRPDLCLPPVRYSGIVVGALSLIALTCIGVVFREFRELFVPLALASFFALVFKPLVARLRARRVPLPVALLVVVLIVAAIAFVTGAVLHASAEPVIAELPSYQPKLETVASSGLDWLKGIVGGFGLRMDDIQASSLFGATRVTADALSSLLGNFLRYLGNAGLLLLYLLFMLAGEGNLEAKLRYALPSDRATKAIEALAEIGRQTRSYLVIRIALGLIDGVATWLICLALGVNFAVFWGILAFLLSFIPYVGFMAALGLPFLFALLQFDTLGRPLALLGALGTESFIVGNVLTPKLIASRQDLSPLLVLVSMIFWGLIWGPWGVVLSTPLAVATKIVFETIPALRPVAVLMRERVPSA